MVGKPWDEAVKSLKVALQYLTKYDEFNVVLFDHDYYILNDTLIDATNANKCHQLGTY